MTRKVITPALVFKVLTLFILAIMGFLFFYGAPVYAQDNAQKVFDNYGYFSESEIDELEELCESYGKEGKVDIVILIENGLGEKTPTKFAEDFFDNHEYGYDKVQGDTVILLLNLEDGNRSVNIYGFENAMHYIHNDRIEYMLDDLVPYLKDGKYFEAIELFAKEVAYYMNQEKGVNTSPVTKDVDSGNYYGESSYDGPSNYYGQEKESVLYNTWFQLIVSFIIGGITVAVMVGNSGGKITTNNRTYLNEGQSGLVAHRDDYIRTTTTRVRKPQNNNTHHTGGGGRSSGGGGISSGGHSHSGGGRSF